MRFETAKPAFRGPTCGRVRKTGHLSRCRMVGERSSCHQLTERFDVPDEVLTRVTVVKAGWLNATLTNNANAVHGVLGAARNTLLCPRCVPGFSTLFGADTLPVFSHQKSPLAAACGRKSRLSIIQETSEVHGQQVLGSSQRLQKS